MSSMHMPWLLTMQMSWLLTMQMSWLQTQQMSWLQTSHHAPATYWSHLLVPIFWSPPTIWSERYGGTAPTLLIVSSYVSCLTGAVVFAWDRSLLIVCSQDICCVCSQDICIVSSQDICIVSSQGICIEDICILSHLNATNHNIRAAQPRACRSFYH